MLSRVEFFNDGHHRSVSAGLQHHRMVGGVLLESRDLSGYLGKNFSDLEHDLLDIAVQIYVADRLCPRPRKNHHQRWRRSICATLAVRNPEHWREPGRNDRLQHLLEYLSDDNWELRYKQASRSPEQGLLELPNQGAPPAVCLFSGGLDSLAGVAAAWKENSHRPLFLVTGCTNTRATDQCESLVGEMSAFSDIHWLRLDYQLRKAPRAQEQSQRTRSLPPMVAAAIVAFRQNVTRVRVMENGVGAINLPYCSSQLGSEGTRSTHPKFLWLLSGWLSHELNSTMQVGLDHPFLTKGQMCKVLGEPHWAGLISRSFSCDVYGCLRTTSSQCGWCTSCLLRRQSLSAAELSAYDRHDYDVDFAGNPTGVVKSQRLLPFQAMSLQAHTMKQALSSANPWAQLHDSYPELSPARLYLQQTYQLDDLQVRENLVQLYRQYVAEWEAFQMSCPIASTWWSPRELTA